MVGTRVQLTSAGWQTRNGISVRGSAFRDGALLDTEEILTALHAISSEEEFSSFVSRLNGFFAMVVEKNGQVFAAVDTIRSIPLFYAVENGFLYISDTAECVQQHLSRRETSDLIRLEFMLAGYVTGSDTLTPGLKQLQSGEYLVHRSPDEWRTRRYFTFLPQAGAENRKAALWEELDQVHIAAVERLAQRAGGRAIVLPLSGGYDSRLLAVLLKQIGYQNVVAYTYGKAASAEVKMARAVAASLGLECRFVEYTNENWWRWYHSAERKDYFRASHNLASIPHIQDWPAVWMLKKDALIPEDAIIAPGHSGDFVAGSHIPESFNGLNQIREGDFVTQVFNQHYTLWRSPKFEPELIGRLRERIAKISELSASGDSSFENAAGKYEAWDWRERQAKFIVNSVRVYDFWGYDWWLPYFDLEVASFWRKVPYQWRIDCRLYTDYAIEKYARAADLPRRVAARRAPSLKPEALTLKTMPYMAARYLYHSLTTNRVRRSKRPMTSYDRNSLAVFGMMDRATFDKHQNEIRNFHSFISRAVLDGDYF